jgi:hypothetical protein
MTFQAFVIERFEESDRRFDRLSQQMAEGFLGVREELRSIKVALGETNKRLDKVIENTGAHWREATW